MRQVSSGFKSQIKELGREIDSIITYYNHYQFITEDNKYILTEDGQKILTEQISETSIEEIEAKDIYRVNLKRFGDLFKTMMKCLEFEVKQDIKIGSIIGYKFGVKVNDSYEYIDYGDFIINSKAFNEDTQNYTYKAYDKMLFTMIPFVAPDISSLQSFTLYDLVQYCCEFCGLELGVELIPNGDREIYDNTLKLLETSENTFRDVLDFCTELTGCSSWVEDNVFIINTPTEVSNNLPSEYTQVEYIESTGTQYIVTDILTKDKMTYYLDVEKTNIRNNGQYVMGYYNGDYYSPLLLGGGTNQSKIGFAVGNSGWLYSNTFLNTNERHFYKSYLGTDYMQLWQDDVQIAYSKQNRTFGNSSYVNLFVYGYNNQNLVNYGFIGKVYKYYAKDINGNKIFDLVPCKRNSDDEVGMYDLVSNTFYTNNGTGEFIAGNEVVVPFDASYFQDVNVKFGKVYGPINSLLFSRSEDTDFVEIKDDESIAEYGVTQIKIKDNPFLEGNDRGDYLEELFDSIKGLTYSINDVNSTGICYLDYYDLYKVAIDNKEYNCLLLNDEIRVTQGLEEYIFTDEPEETTKEYTTSRLSDKGQKYANIQVKKDLAEISLEVGNKVGNDEIISKINLSPEEIKIQSPKIALEGYTTINDGFSVDTLGNMTCRNASVIGGKIDLTGDESTNAKFTITSSSNTNNKMQLMPNLARFYKNGTELIQINTSMTTPFIVVGNYTAIGEASTLQPDGVHTQSDIRLKENIEKLDEEKSIQFITSLNPIEYTYKNNNLYHKGLSAQDVKEKSVNQNAKIYSVDENGFYTLNYVELIPDLINCIKYQQKEIEELKERIGK